MTQKYSKETTEALSNLLQQQPFLATLLYDKMKVVERPGFSHPAATDGHQLIIEPDKFSGYDIHERVFILGHEILHMMLKHCSRMKLYMDRKFGPDIKPFSGKKWNSACDLLVNKLLVDSNVGRKPQDALFDPQIDSATAIVDQIYQGLPDEDSQSQQGFDKHLPPDPNQPPVSDIEMQTSIRQARNAAKAMGNMPGAMERFVSEILEPTVTWKELLRKSLSASMGQDTTTWRKLNRRKMSVQQVFMPGRQGFSALGMVIGIDTSGSVSDDEMRQFLGEVSNILSDVKPEWVKLMWVDSIVQETVDIDQPEDLEDVSPVGGGGTDMGEIFEEITRENYSPECVLVLTDGYTPWGNAEDEPYRVIWGITSKGIEAPYGESIHIDVN